MKRRRRIGERTSRVSARTQLLHDHRNPRGATVPSTVIELVRAHDLRLQGPLRWGRPPACQECGIYLVSMTADPSLLPERNLPDFSVDAIDEWLKHAADMTLDGVRRPSAASIAERLRRFWLPDEPVVYVGQTEQPLQDRIDQFRGHRLGRSSPLRGGHWLKVLRNLSSLYLFYAVCDSPLDTEKSILRLFSGRVSPGSRARLWDKVNPIPFANLRRFDGTIKNHGFEKQVK